jgi:hypothetical protein
LPILRDDGHFRPSSSLPQLRQITAGRDEILYGRWGNGRNRTAKIDRANLGADWVCEFCRTSNTPDRQVAPPALRRGEPAPASRSSGTPSAKRPAAATWIWITFPRNDGSRRPRPKHKRPAWLIPAAVGSFLFLCLCLCLAVFAFGRPQQAEATVSPNLVGADGSGEAFETVVEEDWSVPSDGRTPQPARGNLPLRPGSQPLRNAGAAGLRTGAGRHNSYVCGQEDLGNGFFRDIQCSDPVYETQYRTESYQEPVYISVPSTRPNTAMK